VTYRLIAAINADGNIDGFTAPTTDLQRFQALTIGGTVIMGRKTWDSLPKKPLKHRLNIVLTRSVLNLGNIMETAKDHMVLVAPSLPIALHIADANDGALPWVIGGGEIYREAIGNAQSLYLSHVHAARGGTIAFPPVSAAFERVTLQRHADHDFTIYHRVTA
jgi:dihydrofolate reductase